MEITYIEELGTGEVYKYEIHDLNSSSREYGNCGVCGKYCKDMFTLSEIHRYRKPEILITDDHAYGWTYHDCKSLFGHEECLKEQMRKGSAWNPD